MSRSRRFLVNVRSVIEMIPEYGTKHTTGNRRTINILSSRAEVRCFIFAWVFLTNCGHWDDNKKKSDVQVLWRKFDLPVGRFLFVIIVYLLYNCFYEGRRLVIMSWIFRLLGFVAPRVLLMRGAHVTVSGSRDQSNKTKNRLSSRVFTRNCINILCVMLQQSSFIVYSNGHFFMSLPCKRFPGVRKSFDFFLK